MRGLAAAARLQGQYRSAIKHLERVLEISNTVGEHTGACCSAPPTCAAACSPGGAAHPAAAAVTGACR